MSVHGHTNEANRVLATLVDSRSQEAWSAHIVANLNDVHEALDLLEQALSEGVR